MRYGVIALLVAGCGPGSIGLGLNEVFSDQNIPLEPLGMQPIEGIRDFDNRPNPEITLRGDRPGSHFEARLRSGDTVFGPVFVMNQVMDPNARAQATVTPAEIFGGPLAGGPYLLEVRNVARNVPRDPSEESDFARRAWVVDLEPPSVPQVLEVSVPEPRQLLLRWNSSTDAGTGVEKYLVAYELDLTDDASASLLEQGSTVQSNVENPTRQEVEVTPSTTAQIIEHAIADLQAGARYIVTVEAVDRAGNPSGFDELRAVRTREGGAGTFSAPIPYSVGEGVVGVRAADVNGDGADDVVAAAREEGAGGCVAVLLRKPADDVEGLAGTARLEQLFEPALETDSAIEPTGLAVDDLDEDGFPDVAVCGGDEIAVLLNLRDGTFEDAVCHVVGGPISSIACDRLDDTRTLDIAFTVEVEATGGIPGPSTLRVLVGKIEDSGAAPPGRFADEPGLPVYETRPIWYGFDENGNFQFAKLTILGVELPIPDLEAEFRTFCELSSPVQHNPAALFTTAGAHGAVTADFDRDGRADVAYCELNAVRVVLRIDDTACVDDFRLPPRFPTSRYEPDNNRAFKTGTEPQNLLVDDFDGDGIADLCASHKSGMLTVLLGDGEGGFERQPSVQAGEGGAEIVTGDFDSDGDRDVAMADPSAHMVCVALGNGDGTFKSVSAFAAGGPVDSISSGDFNDDRITDLVVNGGGDVRVLLGQGAQLAGSGRFRRIADPDTEVAAELAIDHDLGNAGVAAADFNGDGLADVVGLGSGTPAGASFSVDLLNFFGGPFEELGKPVVPAGEKFPRFAPIAGVHSTAIGDFDDDGALDVAAAGEDGLVVFLNDDGLLSPTSILFQPAAGESFGDLAAGHFSGDSRMDLAIATATADGGAVVVVRSLGNGSFALLRRYELDGNGPRETRPCITTGDFNRDGIVDLAITANRPAGSGATVFSDVLHVLFGAPGAGGEIRFDTLPARIENPGSNPGSIIGGDFNGDGLQDLAFLKLGEGVTVRLQKADEPEVVAAAFDTEPDDCPPGMQPVMEEITVDGEVVTVPKLDENGIVCEPIPDDGGGGDDDGGDDSGGSGMQGAGSSLFEAQNYGTADGLDTAPDPDDESCNRMVAGDFNSDGVTDIAFVNGNRIRFLRGRKNDVPLLLDLKFPSDGEPAPALSGIAAADLDGDGILDLVVSTRDGKKVILWLGQGRLTPDPGTVDLGE